MKTIQWISIKHLLAYASILIWILFPRKIYGQQSLDNLLDHARTNHPIMELIEMSASEYKLAEQNSQSIYYPAVHLSGQATYQSEVTSIDIPFPGIDIPRPEKDQYKLIAELNQLIYDGGLTKRKKDLIRSKSEMEQTVLLLDWQKLKRTITELYFNSLELDAQLQILNDSRSSIEKALETLQSAIENGVALPSQSMEMKAGLLSLMQKQAELKALRDQVVDQLSILTFTEISPEAHFILPIEKSVDPAIGEGLLYTLLDQQRDLTNKQFKLENVGLRPKLSGFFQAGYGSPGLNFLDSDFTDFYLGGIRFHWNIQQLYTLQKDKEILSLKQLQLDQKRMSFSIQQKVQNSAHDYKIFHLNQQMALDKEIVELRKQISETAALSLEQGILNTTDYLIILNEERKAKETHQLHKIQLIKTQYLKAYDNE